MNVNFLLFVYIKKHKMNTFIDMNFALPSSYIQSNFLNQINKKRHSL
ncbi:hypothetical protein bmyco0003_54830 [Bacillus pseudomycoides]|nr:hypothetical protein bmyco0003_54830 [Bacillus pseudomycoides]